MKTSKLFVDLVDNGLINSWGNLLDWLFDDQKFDNWTPDLLKKYIKKLKRLPNLSNSNYKYDFSINLPFPKKMTRQKIKFLSGKHDGEARDWVRHIRNGIAHGKTRIIKEPDELWIEIKDYNKSGNQTAYIYFPISYICKTYELYKEIDKLKYFHRK